MKITPYSENEVNEMGLMPEGEYDFMVASAKESQSKKGNDMLVLTLRFETDDGRTPKITDYLVAMDSMAYKIRHFAASVGLLKDYEAGTLDAEDAEGRTGKCKIKIKPAEGGYPAKNVVADYIATTDEKPAAKKMAMADLDDEIPF